MTNNPPTPIRSTNSQADMERALRMAGTLKTIARLSDEADVVRLAVGSLAVNGYHQTLEDLAGEGVEG